MKNKFFKIIIILLISPLLRAMEPAGLSKSQWQGIQKQIHRKHQYQLNSTDNFTNYTVALSHNTLAIGAPAEQQKSGVYIFILENNQWLQQAYLTVQNNQKETHFGQLIALYNDTLIVSTTDHSFISGSIYIFKRDAKQWNQQAHIANLDIDSKTPFGYLIALSKDTLAIAGTQTEDSTTAKGIYILKKINNQWRQPSFIKKPKNIHPIRSIINAIALDNNTLVIGASAENAEAGAVYVFVQETETWQLQSTLIGSNTKAGDLGGFPGQTLSLGDRFGHQVAIFEDTIAISAIGEDNLATGINPPQQGNGDLLSSFNDLNHETRRDTGAVYIFTRTAQDWIQEAYIKASNTGIGDHFGESLALFNNILAVGASGEQSKSTGLNGDQSDNSLYNTGAIYVFSRTDKNWSQQAYLKGRQTAPEDYFGQSIALTNNLMVATEDKKQLIQILKKEALIDNTILDSGAIYAIKTNFTDFEQSTTLFNWAEKKYPNIFPEALTTQALDGFFYRGPYPDNGNYMGTKDGRVFVLGDIWGGLIEVGKLKALINNLE